VDQTAPVKLQAAYERLVKAASQVEKLAGDASLLSKGKGSKERKERVLVQDPKTIASDAVKLATQAYAVIGSKPPKSKGKDADELHAAYHEILAAADGIELVRHKANPEKMIAFAATMDPDEVEGDVKNLVEDMKEAEEEMEDAEKELEKIAEHEEKSDDKHDVTESTAAKEAADQALAEADHEQHGGDQLVAKAEGDKAAEEKAAAKKAEAKADVEEETAEHKEADAVHEAHDKEDDKHEEKLAAAKEEHEEAKEEHEESVEDYNEHPDVEEHEEVNLKGSEKKPEPEPKKSGTQQLVPYAAILILAMFC